MFDHVDRFGHDGWWWADRFLPFLLLVLVVGLAVWAIVRYGSRASIGPAVAAAAPTDRALEEVRLRYAKGEIDREDFARRSHDLGGSTVEIPPIVATDEPAAPSDEPPPSS